jgi:hypothetical protein
MSWNFNILNSVDSNLKTQFVSNYGKFSTGFENIDPLGNQKLNTQWPIFIIVIGIILAVLSYVGSKPEKDEKTGADKERTNMQKFLFGLTWLFILCTIFGAGYGGYLYFAIYLPEYFKWFQSLPLDAKTMLSMITTVDKINAKAISGN